MRITLEKAIELAAEDPAIAAIILSAARVVESRMEIQQSIASNWGNPDASLTLHEAMAIQEELSEISRRNQASTDAEFLQSVASAEMTTHLSTNDAIDAWRRVVRAIEFD